MTQTVDLLLTNALILTMDEEMRQFSSGAVAVQGDSIIAVGPEADLRREYQGRASVDCGGKLLLPGLVNAHTHVPMTLLRGLADDLRLDVWLMGYMMPVERQYVSPEFVRLGRGGNRDLGKFCRARGLVHQRVGDQHRALARQKEGQPEHQRAPLQVDHPRDIAQHVERVARQPRDHARRVAAGHKADRGERKQDGRQRHLC